jgi:hypothetical protein
MPRYALAATAALSALLLAACGGGKNDLPNEVLQPPSSVGPPPSASAAASPGATVPGRRTPPDALLRYWFLEARPRFAAYADLGGLLHTELGRAIVPASISLAQDSITPEQAQCLRGTAESVRDLAVGVGEDSGGIVIARFDDSAFDPGPCLIGAGARPTTVGGGKQAFDVHGTFVVHEPGVLLVGSPIHVTKALTPRAGEATFPHALALGPDEFVAWSARIDQDSRAHGTLLASSERFRIGVEADVPSYIAGQVEDQLHSLQLRSTVPGLDGEDGALALRLLKSVQMTRDGSHLSGAFDLHEPPADQARDVGLMASLAISSVRKYMVAAKSAEARNAIGQIARDYAAWWEREDGTPRGKRRLVSFPPVPKTVPRGSKYQSTPDDWKPWAPLRFEMDAPQYYQYEVRASKDGGTADIIARGDLDADGKDSEFKLHLTVDRARDMLVIAPSLEEKDPDD